MTLGKAKLHMRKSDINLGKSLREARKKRHLTQHELAEKIGKKQSYISVIEKNPENNIKIKTLIDIVEKGLDGHVKIEIIV